MIAPHDMVTETMFRHDKYFRKYYKKKLTNEKKQLLDEKENLEIAKNKLRTKFNEIQRQELKVKFHEQILQGLDNLRDIEGVSILSKPEHAISSPKTISKNKIVNFPSIFAADELIDGFTPSNFSNRIG